MSFCRGASLLSIFTFVLLLVCFPVGSQQPTLTNAFNVRFKDSTTANGLTIGTDAACWVDVDNDGWPDLITGGIVWHNNQGKGFSKLAEGVGSVVSADYDNDGFPDIFSYSQMKLYHNNAGKSFTEVKLPALPATSSRGACWADLNGDGFVDLYIGGYEDWDRDITYPSMILMNQAGKGFKLVWTAKEHRTRGVTACDFNQSHRTSVYVSNYRLQANQLFINDGGETFTDRASQYNVVATSPGFEGGHSIGACWGDFDSDGYFDLFAGNFAHVDDRGDQPKSRFLRNKGPQSAYCFEDMGTCGVFYQESYASPAAGDYDNDGYLDLFFTTVYGTASFNRQNFPVLFHNDKRFKFSDATRSAGVDNLPPTYQAAWADFNHDGCLDLVAGGKLFENTGGTGNSWIEVHLVGDGHHVNCSAIGAQVRIRLSDKTVTRQVEAGTGEGNQNDLTIHFGLGNKKGHVILLITWPDGKLQAIRGVAVNHIVNVKYR